LAGSSKKSHPGSQPELSDGEIRDAAEVLEAEIPSDMARRVAANWELIREFRFQHKTGAVGWLRSKQVVKTGTPPKMDVDEICLRVLEMIQDHAEGPEPAEHYRGVLTIRMPNSTKDLFRYLPVRSMLRSDGSLGFVDDGRAESEPGTEAAGAAAIVASLLEPFTDQAIRSLGAVVEATEGYGSVANGFKTVLGEATAAWRELRESRTADAEIELRREEIELRRDLEGFFHEQKLARYQHLSDFAQELAGPIAEMFADYMSEMWQGMGMEPPDLEGAKQDREGRRGSANPGGRGRMSSQLDQWLRKLPPDELGKFKDLFAEDEWAVLEKGRAVQSDDEFAALFKKLRELFVARGLDTKSFQDGVVAAVGKMRAMKFAKILRNLKHYNV